VIESGEGLTQAVPVFEGYAIPHAIFKMEVAGYDITQKVMKMMRKKRVQSTLETCG
jgi:actin-related protein